MTADPRTPEQVAEEARKKLDRALVKYREANYQTVVGYQREVIKAIDRTLAAARWAMAEGMHVKRCNCHDFDIDILTVDGPIVCQRVLGRNERDHHLHPFTDPRCAATRNWMRAEYESLAKGEAGR